MKKLKKEAENNIFFPRLVFMLTFPAVSNPDNAPNHADENINPNSVGVPSNKSINAGRAWM